MTAPRSGQLLGWLMQNGQSGSLQGKEDGVSRKYAPAMQDAACHQNADACRNDDDTWLGQCKSHTSMYLELFGTQSVMDIHRFRCSSLRV
nr:hypothetical protein CFP56_21877 [Quercus suber]